MYARMRFDIGWSDLAHALWFSAVRHDSRADIELIERWFDGGCGDALACLSVRTALDLYLSELALPAGSEVLMSALTIPDMWKVVQHHGLVPVPVDVEAETLAPGAEAWRAACTPRTRLAIVAHLFGTRIDLEPLRVLRSERGIHVLEDCAQAFTGPEWKGDPRADVSLFSFGPIKTATALAGAVVRVRDTGLLARLRERHQAYPHQTSAPFASRVLKYAVLKAVSSRLPYGAFVRLCELSGGGIDRVIQSTVRGFKGGDLFQKLRQQPSVPMYALLARRLRRCDGARAAGRMQRARALAGQLGRGVEIPGIGAPFHSYWVFTVLARDPEGLVARLRAHGFDATRVATLSAVPAPPGRPEQEPHAARTLLSRLVYVPLYAELGVRPVHRMARLIAADAVHAAQTRKDDARIPYRARDNGGQRRTS